MSNPLIAAVRKHALEHYNEDGWDFVVECYEDYEIMELVNGAGAQTELQAIAAVGAQMLLLNELRREVRNA